MHYVNPVLFADYSDPDVIRVGEDFYLISSSFTYFPGIPVLHSTDLVHWHCVSYVVPSLPFSRYDVPAHKRGTWAPSLRYHNGTFYVYVCLPDEGLLAFTAESACGPWTCHVVKEVCGWIDPCPFWDEDGQAYLVHGLAGSRAGLKNMLFLHTLSPDGLSVTSEGRLVFDGYAHGDTTTEGPKMYKTHGYYFILCPAGGVTEGYQLALRSRGVWGPYERKVVLAQGNTAVNGPHQGGLVTGPDGQSWFMHFQDQGVYGRVVHLQPVTWTDDWPIMGKEGEPVSSFEVPYPNLITESLSMEDDFRGPLKNQWQFQANPRKNWYAEGDGLTLHAQFAPSIFEAGSFLSQLLRHRSFDLRVTVEGHLGKHERAGLAMMGYRYSACALTAHGLCLYEGEATEPSLRLPEIVTENAVCTLPDVPQKAELIVRVRDGKCSYAVCCGGNETQVGKTFDMSCGGWTGARLGIFCLSSVPFTEGSACFRDMKVTVYD